MDTRIHTPLARGKLRELERILVIVDALNHGAPAPRLILARLYSVIFSALAFLATPAGWGLARAVVAAAIGIGMLELLARFGPGRASWWTCLSDQLRSYEPIDLAALESLRKDLAANGKQGKRHALLRVIDWSRTERAAITESPRRGA